MALLKKGLARTVWALGGLVAFFFGLVGASPPAWAESGVRVAQAEKPSVPPRPSPAPPRVEMPSKQRMGEVIPKLEPTGQKFEKASPKLNPASATSGATDMKFEGLDAEAPIPKLETLPGEPFGTAIPKLETPGGGGENRDEVEVHFYKVEPKSVKGEAQGIEGLDGESRGIEGVDGEALDKSTPKLNTPPGDLEAGGQLKIEGVDGD